VPAEGRKRFFLKKEAKTFIGLARAVGQNKRVLQRMFCSQPSLRSLAA
jgi:hypothetical protein